MTKQLIVDHISNITYADVITENFDVNSTSLNEFVLTGIIQKADTKNGNGRIYPRATLEREINRFIENTVKINAVAGELDHPDSTIVTLANASHTITKIWWEGTNVMAKIKLLNTPSGKIAQELVKARVPLGISSRGMGSIQQIGETLRVGDDFDLLCFDLVSVPSTSGAYLFPENTSLSESLDKSVVFDQKYLKINSLMTEILSMS